MTRALRVRAGSLRQVVDLPFLPPPDKPRSKYGAKRVTVDGITFDSQAEARRWHELKLLEQAGYIRNLERQVPFVITVNGKHICKYYADAVYFEGSILVLEDTKGKVTPVYRLKRKLVEAQYGLTIREVKAR